MEDKKLNLFNVAALYVGTIMGAGFASGLAVFRCVWCKGIHRNNHCGNSVYGDWYDGGIHRSFAGYCGYGAYYRVFR